MAIFDGWQAEDIYRYRDNKYNWDNTDNKAYRDVYHMNNQNIRRRYGIDEAQDVSLGEVNAYIDEMERRNARQNSKNALLTDLTQRSANTNERVRNSADAIRNFNYNPETDAAYQAYADMYNRQGQSAAKQTINNLNAANMGRNSSYSGAAAAQVQQAYAQKASEMVPVLAQQTYDRLLGQYNLERQLANDEYNKQLTMYNLLADDYTRELTDNSLRENNEYNRWTHEQDYTYSPVERRQNIELGNEEIAQSKIKSAMAQLDLSVYPDVLKNSVESGKLANELSQLKIENMGYQNRVDAITALIHETYGMDMEDANLVAVKLANSINQKKLSYM